MRFIFSIMTLASMAGALLVLYFSADSFLKVSHGSAEDKARAAERAAKIGERMLQRYGGSVKVNPNDNPFFALLRSKSSEDGSVANGPESKDIGTTIPKAPVVQPAPSVWPFFHAAPATVAWRPRVIPPHKPTPAEEALAVYRKYATPG